jgi:Acyl-ACP thioesterase
MRPTYEKQIEVRWRDFDAARHVNNAVYLNDIEEARVARDSKTVRSRPLSPDELAALDSAREPDSAGQT